MSVLESTNGINIRRPRREGQHQVIYRECDSDDEDFETVLLLQGLVQAAKQGTKPATAQPSEPLPPLSPLLSVFVPSGYIQLLEAALYPGLVALTTIHG